MQGRKRQRILQRAREPKEKVLLQEEKIPERDAMKRQKREKSMRLGAALMRPNSFMRETLEAEKSHETDAILREGKAKYQEHK